MRDRTAATSSTIGRFRRIVTPAWAVVFLAACVGAVLVSTTLLTQRADAVAAPPPAPLTTVRAMRVYRSETFPVTRSFAGQVEAARAAALGFETSGQVTAILVNEGQQVSRGTPLARLDTRLLAADRARLQAGRGALEAQAELARLTAGRQETLQQRGHAATQALDSARLGLSELQARMAEVDASLARIAVLEAQSVLQAPFDGTVGDILVDDGTVVAPGNPVVALLDDAPALFRVGLDPALTADPGLFDHVTVRIGGIEHPADFAGLRPDLDATTRTRTALFELDGISSVYLQSGTLDLETAVRQPGYAVPVTALQDGIRGLWTVLTLQPGPEGAYTVAAEAVELLHADQSQAYVRGTFGDGALVVTDGTHRIVPGERVTLASGAE